MRAAGSKTRRAHWPVSGGLGLLRLGAAMPQALHPALGSALGSALRRLLPGRAAVARDNLALCFPEQSAAAREDLVAAHFQALGRGLLGLGMAWWSPAARLHGLEDVTGLAHLQDALARGHGVILLSGHFTDLELGGRLLALHQPFHVMYRRHEHPVIERAMHANRTRHFERAIPRNDVRGMLRSLRGGHAVWYAPDQRYTGAGSVTVPFFGQPAATTTATARLAGITAAPVVPFFPRRLPDGRRLHLTIGPPLEEFPTGDLAADTARVNHTIELQARSALPQYWWVHRRFKNLAGRDSTPKTA